MSNKKFKTAVILSLVLSFIITLTITPLVSAYGDWGYGLNFYSLQNLFQNEIIFFALIFLVFFALTYFALSRTMHESKGAVVVIATVMALFIAFTVSQRTRFYGYVGETIGSWLLIIALILAFLILIRVITSIIGGFGLFFSLGALWLVLGNMDPYSFLPSEFLYSNFFQYYEFLVGSTFLTLLIIAFVIVLIAAYAGNNDINLRIKKWLFPPLFKKPEYVAARRA